MASTDNLENDRLGREFQKLEINTNNAGLMDPFDNLNIIRLRTRAIPVASLVPQDRLLG